MDPARCQTVYAAGPRSAAAPTAGLHLTRELLAELGRRGVEVCRVRLEVGLGEIRAAISAGELAALVAERRGELSSGCPSPPRQSSATAV